ncbi:CaiB/BaiF CoA transferase family protein [candidate division CSSED10-310 bacterium]|uniref:CaiB/BaiF CoA transferase family protein n=1 Tax=candidate division CSSED10-310 bacterium TaxID=2855610 RepID=A0ABV6YUS7_UNCC1
MTVYSLLNGIRILDLTRLLPGPMCTLFLADMGAEVIKIEQPGVGDYIRWVPPLHKQEGVAFLALNRNKKSICLDIKKEQGREIFMKLVADSDVIIESFRPGVTERIGIDYQRVVLTKPDMIYCSLTGFGQESPYRNRADHDINYLALSGLFHYFFLAQDQPVVPPIQLADVGGGSFPAAIGILAALVNRNKTGKGEYIDVSMLDGLMTWSSLLSAAYFSGGREPKIGEGLLAGEYPCYNLYRTADDRFISVGTIEPKFWVSFLKVIGRPDLKNKQFAEGEEATDIRAEIQNIIEQEPLSYWQERFSGENQCVEPLLTLSEALTQQHVVQRGLLKTLHHPTEGDIQQIGHPLKYTQSAQKNDTHPPKLGEHTQEILQQLGFNQDDIKQLKEDKVIS